MDQGEMEEDILAECLHYTESDMITPSLVKSGKTFLVIITLILIYDWSVNCLPSISTNLCLIFTHHSISTSSLVIVDIRYLSNALQWWVSKGFPAEVRPEALQSQVFTQLLFRKLVQTIWPNCINIFHELNAFSSSFITTLLHNHNHNRLWNVIT